METMKMLFRQLSTSQKEKISLFFKKKKLLACVCYSSLKHILLTNSTCFISPFSHVNKFFSKKANFIV